MRSTQFASVAALVVLGVLGGGAPRADEGVDLSCAWRSFGRRCVVRRAKPSLRARGKLDVVCDGSPGPRSVAVAIYASSDGSVAPGAAPVASKRVRARPGRTVRVAFDVAIPFGASGRFVVARVDDAGDAAERDETNNFAVAGPLSTGEEFAPLEPGNQWRYAGTDGSGRRPPVPYTNRVAVEGDHVVGEGVVAQAVSSSNSRNSGRAIVEYLQRDERGVVDWGNDDADDWVTRRIAPFRAVLFPFDAPYKFTSVRRSGLRYPQDADGDGRLERLDAVQRVGFVGLEDVDLPVGRFANCAHIRTRAVAVVTLSQSGLPVVVVGTQHQWLAPGIGSVRIVERISGPGVNDSTEETLTGAATATGGCGVVDGLTFASISAPAGDAFNAAPSAASDGTTTLLATVRAPADGDPHGLIGVLLGPTGRAVRQVQIADIPVDGNSPPTPTAAYGAGLFAIAYRGNGAPLQVLAVAPDGSLPWGADAVDVPVLCGTDRTFRVAFDGTQFVVLAQGLDQGSNEATLVAARVSPSGEFVGSTRLATPYLPGGVAAAWDGWSTLCVWSTDTELNAVRLRPSGTVLDAVPIRLAVGPDHKSSPAVVASPSGGWLVAWTHSRSGGQTRVRHCLVSGDGVANSAQGFEIDSTSYWEGRPEVALDGAEFLVVAQSSSVPAVHLVRLTLDGAEVPQGDGGFGPTFATPAWTESLQSPIVVGMRDRALVAWQRTSWTAGVGPAIVGALVFPRRTALAGLRQ